MTDLFDYVAWRGDLSFEQSPFCEVDGMILSAISYLPFERAGLSENKEYTIDEAISMVKDIPDFEKYLLLKSDSILLEKIPFAKRFSELKIIAYKSIIDEANESQFFAMTVGLTKKLDAVIYRGTDNTLVGWKENFNMCFSTPVPAQKMALEYLSKRTKSIGKKLILAGHSKGGNLAIYAAAFCSGRLQKRIEKIYNYDGPGFCESVLSTKGYQSVCNKIKTFVPEASIVGMLLGRGEEYTVVLSSVGIDLLQHNIYTWGVLRNEFLYLDEISKRSRFIDDTLKDWLLGLTIKERESLVDTIYNILSQTDAKTVNDLRDNWFENSKKIFVSIKNLEPQTKKGVGRIFKMLFASAKSVAGKIDQKDKK